MTGWLFFIEVECVLLAVNCLIAACCVWLLRKAGVIE